jgi:predicted dehydrogenase
MKYLQIGLGSMGKRRLRNLKYLNISSSQIAGFDLSQERATEVSKDFGIQTYTSFNQAVSDFQPDVFIISTPPHLHAEYFLYAAAHHKHFFVEVGTTDQGLDQLLPLLPDTSLVAAPSCTYRYYQPIQFMKKLLAENKIGQIQAFTHHFGQYLPDWHPWEDYRKFYVSKQESSACREMVVFELGWLQWLINQKITSVKGFHDKCSQLDMKISDTYVAALQTEHHTLGTLMIEVISRSPFRTLRIIGSEGVIEWEWQQRRVRLFTIDQKKWQTFTFPKGKKTKGYLTTTEEMYEQEMSAFVEAVNGHQPYPHSFQEEYDTLQLLKQLDLHL